MRLLPRARRLAGAAGLLLAACSQTAESNAIDARAGSASTTLESVKPVMPVMRERAVFAAGCFWGVESTFRAVDGVLETTVGYTGGTKPEPNYRQVCNGDTGHAEAVEVWFDPARTSYEALLGIFFANHDPTQVNRQGVDVGAQYRSAIFFSTPQQEAAARAAIAALTASGRFHRPIATQVAPLAEFWRAEEYHQQYYEKKGIAPACKTH